MDRPLSHFTLPVRCRNDTYTCKAELVNARDTIIIHSTSSSPSSVSATRSRCINQTEFDYSWDVIGLVFAVCGTASYRHGTRIMVFYDSLGRLPLVPELQHPGAEPRTRRLATSLLSWMSLLPYCFLHEE